MVMEEFTYLPHGAESFLKANQFSASQYILHILWNPKVHYRIYKCRHLSLSRARSIQSTPPSQLTEDQS